MRIGISLLTLSAEDLGGSEVYARELLGALASSETHDYTVFAPFRAASVASSFRTVSVHDVPGARRGPARVAAMKLAARASSTVRRELRQVELLHYPLTVPVPRFRGPVVVTVHDLQHRDHPHFLSGSRRSFRRASYDRSAQRATAVVVPSHFVRESILEHLELDPTHVQVIAHGVDHALFTAREESREPFLLYPARPWPHKNHGRLLEAFALLRVELPELRLVLTGRGLEALGELPEGVERLGFVTAEELASLYRTAACLVFPSLYEGFGLPPLEAMACGCPVAAANAGAIPEVCGDAAVYFDAHDPEAIANGVREALALADELHELGMARAALFRWEDSALRHEEVFRVAGES